MKRGILTLYRQQQQIESVSCKPSDVQIIRTGTDRAAQCVCKIEHKQFHVKHGVRSLVMSMQVGVSLYPPVGLVLAALGGDPSPQSRGEGALSGSPGEHQPLALL